MCWKLSYTCKNIHRYLVRKSRTIYYFFFVTLHAKCFRLWMLCFLSCRSGYAVFHDAHRTGSRYRFVESRKSRTVVKRGPVLACWSGGTRDVYTWRATSSAMKTPMRKPGSVPRTPVPGPGLVAVNETWPTIVTRGVLEQFAKWLFHVHYLKCIESHFYFTLIILFVIFQIFIFSLCERKYHNSRMLYRNLKNIKSFRY